MGKILDRLAALTRRAEGSPPPAVAAAMARVLTEGKRAHLAAGRDAQGRAYAPLAPSTLRARGRASPVPLVGRRGEASSSLVTRYRVEARARPSGLDLAAGWDGAPHVRYLRSGTRRMPARDPGGFRPADAAECLRIYREWLDRG